MTDASTIAATGATLNLGDQSSSSTNAWSNTGTISATNATVNLGGLFTLAGLGTFNRTGGTVNLAGTLNNTGTTLALTTTTGSWNLAGGTLNGGTLTESGGAELVFTSSGGTLDGVTAAGNLDLASNNNANAYVKDGLTLNNATVLLGNAAGTTYGYLYFQGTQTPGGHGRGALRQERQQLHYETASGADADDRVGRSRCRGSSGTLGACAAIAHVVNQGTISADDSGGVAGNFVYDKGFSGGGSSYSADAIDTSGVSNPAPQAVWQTFRERAVSATTWAA